jgi:hypothetical protein
MSNLIGTAANQVPTNGLLGTAAFVNITELKSLIGLANVDNTSDADKPIPSAVASALAQIDPIVYAIALG